MGTEKILFNDEKWCVFEELCHIQCTKDEICSVLRVTHKVLEDRVKEHFQCDFQDIYKILSDGGKSSLRRIQMRQAETNTSMAIWLGKIYLAQRDYEADKINMNNALGILGHIKELKILDEHVDSFKKASDQHSSGSVTL